MADAHGAAQEGHCENTNRAKRLLLDTIENMLHDDKESNVHVRTLQKENDAPDVSTEHAWQVRKVDNVKFDEIFGLDHILQIIQESLILPQKYPKIFERMCVTSSKCILLYGPPGTGKSMVARAIANETSATFLEASCAQLTSRWVGESEKLVQCLFSTASTQAPSVVFLDEIDSIAVSRETDKSTSVADQRLLNQLLIEIDVIQKNKTTVFIIAATNLPWQIDPAMIRRFNKMVHVGLPCVKTRASILRRGLEHATKMSDHEFEALASRAEDMSGSDLKNAITEILMRPLRRILSAKSFFVSGDDANGFVVSLEEIVPESSVEESCFGDMCEKYGEMSIQIPDITFADALSAVESQKRSVSMEMQQRYTEYEAQ